ncbi:hypothetical protein D9615_000952 [Tricholomella constricta]|uniref:Uncharacterized protein n=1 Tax=Tricholomella constricta TaxID=117010 RepID=A0A8H5M8G2_9AGAR|nr:hypothetical protein D9615_000952 [Tricholomella constricta]
MGIGVTTKTKSYEQTYQQGSGEGALYGGGSTEYLRPLALVPVRVETTEDGAATECVPSFDCSLPVLLPEELEKGGYWLIDVLVSGSAPKATCRV